MKGTSDPFVELRLNRLDLKVIKTNHLNDNANPVWNEQGIFSIEIKDPNDENLILDVQCWDYGKQI